MPVGIETILKDTLRSAYDVDYSFEHGTFGDTLLQAARITAFRTMVGNEKDLSDILNNPLQREVFLREVKKEVNEKGRELEFMPSFDKDVGDRRLMDIFVCEPEIESGLQQQEIRAFNMEDLKKVLAPEDFQMAKVFGPEQLSRVIGYTGKEDSLLPIGKGLEKIRKILHQSSERRYYPLRNAYATSLRDLYERVRTGEVSSWKRLLHNHNSFFDWKINLQEVIRHATENHILDHYKCSLEDLPLQKNIDGALIKFKIRILSKIGNSGFRDYFLIGFPEMKNHPSWHPARWQEYPRKKIPEETKEEYSKFRRNYLFTRVLGCRTREDVINALNDEETMIKAAKKENFQRVPKKASKESRPYFFRLIQGLDGPLYDIQPWELNILPRGTFWNNDGSPNKDKIREYLAWTDKKYGVPFSLLDEKKFKHIPYFHIMKDSGLTAAELRALCPREMIPWQISLKLPNNANTWLAEDGSPNMPVIKEYLEWVGKNYNFPASSHESGIPHFRYMYRSSKLSFLELKSLFEEVNKKSRDDSKKLIYPNF